MPITHTTVASGIYKITNTVSAKVYIGSAIDLSRRKREHMDALRRNKHKNAKLQNAFNKFGEEAFIYQPIIICRKKDLIMYEQLAFRAKQREASNAY